MIKNIIISLLLILIVYYLIPTQTKEEMKINNRLILSDPDNSQEPSNDSLTIKDKNKQYLKENKKHINKVCKEMTKYIKGSSVIRAYANQENTYCEFQYLDSNGNKKAKSLPFWEIELILEYEKSKKQ